MDTVLLEFTAKGHSEEFSINSSLLFHPAYFLMTYYELGHVLCAREVKINRHGLTLANSYKHTHTKKQANGRC